MPRSEHLTSDSSLIWRGALGLMAVAILFGGGGSNFPLPELVVELAGAVLLLAIAATKARDAGRDARFPLALMGAVIGLAAFQLLPLPPALWQSLPGRDFAQSGSLLAGTWRPISLDPEETVRSILALTPAAVMFCATLRLPSRHVDHMAALVALGATVQTLVALAQLASGGRTAFYPYETDHVGLAVGLFGNRNHFAAFLLTGIMASSLAFSRGAGASQHRLLLLLGILVLLSAGIIASGSRSCAILLPPALFSGLILSRWIESRRSRALAAVAAAVLIATAGLVASSGGPSAVNRLADRFAAVDQPGEARYDIWRDTEFGAEKFFPVGAGLGTFETAFKPVEQLSEVGSHYKNHAHDEYLEIAFEAGLPGLLLVTAALGWLLFETWRFWRDRIPDHARAAGRAGSIALLFLALHSFVDYPLRSLTISTVAGFWIALLCRRSLRGRDQKRIRRPAGRSETRAAERGEIQAYPRAWADPLSQNH